MKPDALARECIRVLKEQPGAPFIVVIGKLPVKGWPRGKCVGSDSRGRFYMYPSAKILARLVMLGVLRFEMVRTAAIADQPGTYITRMTIPSTNEVFDIDSEGTRIFLLAIDGYLCRGRPDVAPLPTEEP